MSQVNLQNNNNVPNIEPQNAPNVENPQPQNLPPELQNARPSRARSILAKIGSFLFGAGAAGGASVAFGGGAAVVGVLESSAVAVLGGATIAAGIATGGIALIGGTIALGLFIGIRALVRHFSQAPAPAPRLNDQPPNNLPEAQPPVDTFNKSIASFVINGHGALPASLEQASKQAIARMREMYGADLIPPDVKLHHLCQRTGSEFGNDITKLTEYITAEQMETLTEKHIRASIPYTIIENALKPLCPDKIEIRSIANAFLHRHPELHDSLSKIQSPAEVQNILQGLTQELNSMVQLNTQLQQLRSDVVPRIIATIAQSMHLDPKVLTPIMQTYKITTASGALQKRLLTENANPETATQEFSNLVTQTAKSYVDSLKAVDDNADLSTAAKKVLKQEILNSESPNPDLIKKGFAAGKNVNATELKIALEQGCSQDALINILMNLGKKLNEELAKQYSQEEWTALATRKAPELRMTQGAAFMAMVDDVPGLRETLGTRANADIFNALSAGDG